VEETGNLLILVAAMDHLEVDLRVFYASYWPLLQQWAEYLVDTLPDPGDQLCTDDFEGPSPHNANLAAKGIIGLAAYQYLCQQENRHDESARYFRIVQNYTQIWMAWAADRQGGDHYRLQYDLPGTWSLKYNLMLQKVLGLSGFPDEVVNDEVSYYISQHLNTFGVPLDNRATFTKLDWLAWVAAMSSDADEFSTLIHSIYLFAHRSSSRVPLSDWYDTVSGQQTGFQARPVVGGLFSKMLFK